MRAEPQPVNAAPPGLPDLNRVLEQQLSAGFPPELALDLALQDLVVCAASLTHASAAALALARGNEMVCRAATGLQAPDLGVPLNTRDGLSGACLRTRQPQLCSDAESDPLVDAAAARRLGIRSMLIVPVLDEDAIAGVLEVFSPDPGAFTSEHQSVLESLASDCARILQGVAEARIHRPSESAFASIVAPSETEESSGPDVPPAALESAPSPVPSRSYDPWTLVLGMLAVLAAVGLSFLIGFRTGWLRAPLSHIRPQLSPPVSVTTQESPLPPAPPVQSSAPRHSVPASSTAGAKPEELVVYDHGKVIFRMKPVTKKGDAVIAASERARLKSARVWLAPEQAERRLRSRIEPTYPPDALAAHRSGEVVLEILVAEDGSVASIRTLSGDPALAAAAADAVRNWRYEPYRSHQRPTPFQTDVTLTFSLPN